MIRTGLYQVPAGVVGDHVTEGEGFATWQQDGAVVDEMPTGNLFTDKHLKLVKIDSAGIVQVHHRYQFVNSPPIRGQPTCNMPEHDAVVRNTVLYSTVL